MQTQKKKKYSIDEYAAGNRGNPIIETFNSSNQKLQCFCGDVDQIQGLRCYRCNKFVHKCLEPKLNRVDKFQCLSCINYYLDPLYPVTGILVQSYFRINNIFDYQNIINFQFYLTQDDLKGMIQIRGLKPQHSYLSWPMQGSFYLNDEISPFYQLKPLLSNSNRKTRREQYFLIPHSGLKLGRNFIRFKIIKLDKHRFLNKFQAEQKGTFFFSINKVKRLTIELLTASVFSKSKVQKEQSLALLKKINSHFSDIDITVDLSKICLICPYTRERIKIPVRGKYCNHFSCVCLETLAASHSQSRFWSCPICESRINQPQLDVWIYQMLKDNHKGSDVIVKQDGTYEWVPVKDIQVQSFDDEDESQKHIEAEQKKKTQKEKEIQSLKKMEKGKQTIVISDRQKEPQKIKDSEKLTIQKLFSPQLQLIDLDDQSVQNSNKILKQTLKQKQNQLKLAIRNEIASNSSKIKKSSKKSNNSKSQDFLHHTSEVHSLSQSLKVESLSAVKKRLPEVLIDIPIMDFKEMKLEQFRKYYFKFNFQHLKKQIHSDELRKLFKPFM